MNSSSLPMLVDLSNASDDALTLVLLQLPCVDLLKNCTLVSKQWNCILSQKSFWIAKAELEGYKLEWPRLAALSIRTYQAIAMQKPFGRNFIRDSWNLEKQDASCWQRDERWKLNQRPYRPPLLGCSLTIEVPPVFMDDQPKINPEIGDNPKACLATSSQSMRFIKWISIKLSDEGLTDELMDKFRPTLIVSELVANWRDCASQYRMRCRLQKEKSDRGLDNAVSTVKTFPQWEAESWHRVQCTLKDYPPGMRYLFVECFGQDSENRRKGNYGVKMANCRVEAICESNRNNGEKNGTN